MLALVSGDNRADEALIEAAIGEPVERPDAAYVREVTGYAIGGIPPVGHPRRSGRCSTRTCCASSTVWAAAGHPHAVFPIAPRTLAEKTGATVAPLKT